MKNKNYYIITIVVSFIIVLICNIIFYKKYIYLNKEINLFNISIQTNIQTDFFKKFHIKEILKKKTFYFSNTDNPKNVKNTELENVKEYEIYPLLNIYNEYNHFFNKVSYLDFLKIIKKLETEEKISIKSSLDISPNEIIINVIIENIDHKLKAEKIINIMNSLIREFIYKHNRLFIYEINLIMSINKIDKDSIIKYVENLDKEKIYINSEIKEKKFNNKDRLNLLNINIFAIIASALITSLIIGIIQLVKEIKRKNYNPKRLNLQKIGSNLKK